MAAITFEILTRIAERQCKGYPLRFALALEPEPLTISHWNQQLASTPRLARLYDQQLARGLSPFIEAMMDPTRNLRNMPAAIWLMERVFPDAFAQPKHLDPNGPAVTNNILIQGVSDAAVLRRAAKLIRDASRPADQRTGSRGVKHVSHAKQAISSIDASVIDVKAIAKHEPEPVTPTTSVDETQ